MQPVKIEAAAPLWLFGSQESWTSWVDLAVACRTLLLSMSLCCPLFLPSLMQFVVSQDLPNSSYMTALQQLIAAGYVTLIMIGLESVFIWWLSTYHRTGQRCVLLPVMLAVNCTVHARRT